MAKPIVVNLGGNESRFSFSKLSRSKLYGKKRRVVLDPDGNPCAKAALTEDGSMLLKSGMTGQGYFDEGGRLYERGALVGLDSDGNTVEKNDSTLGTPQTLEGPVNPEDVLDLAVSSIYLLEVQELDGGLETALGEGKVFRFPFNYYADYQQEVAYLLKNDHGIFALIGSVTTPEWCETEEVPVETFEEATLEEDDLDFDMF